MFTSKIVARSIKYIGSCFILVLHFPVMVDPLVVSFILKGYLIGEGVGGVGLNITHYICKYAAIKYLNFIIGCQKVCSWHWLNLLYSVLWYLWVCRIKHKPRLYGFLLRLIRPKGHTVCFSLFSSNSLFYNNNAHCSTLHAYVWILHILSDICCELLNIFTIHTLGQICCFSSLAATLHSQLWYHLELSVR